MTTSDEPPETSARELADRFAVRVENNHARWPHKVDHVIEGCYSLASLMTAELQDNPELRQGLQHLLRAREQFLLAAIT